MFVSLRLGPPSWALSAAGTVTGVPAGWVASGSHSVMRSVWWELQHPAGMVLPPRAQTAWLLPLVRRLPTPGAARVVPLLAVLVASGW